MELKRKTHETIEQYNFRKNIWIKVYEDTRDEESAIIYSNIWINILSLGCEYPSEIMNKIEKYKPEKNIYI